MTFHQNLDPTISKFSILLLFSGYGSFAFLDPVVVGDPDTCTCLGMDKQEKGIALFVQVMFPIDGKNSGCHFVLVTVISEI